MKSQSRLLSLVVFAGACTATPVGQKVDAYARASAQGKTVVQSVAAKDYPRICSTHAAVLPGEAVLLLSARSCLTCRGVGHLARRLQEAYRDLAVIVPASDSLEMCRFLRVERIHSPVVAVPDTVFRLESIGPLIVFVSRDAPGDTLEAMAGRDAEALVQAISPSSTRHD